MSDEQAQQRAEQESRRRARSFGPAAAAFDRGRPSYPRDAAKWLVGGQARTVLELGAGTGKLTEQLVALGHDVHATEPDAGMLDVLETRVPEARTEVAGAEEIPLGDRTVDVVVCAQSFHWFDHELALPEIARVLKPRGHLALVWNLTDVRIPWVRRLSALLGQEGEPDELVDPLVHSGLFGFVEEKTFRNRQEVNRETILDLASSRSSIAALSEEERTAKLAEVLRFYDDYGRGMDGMQLPYRVSCFRAVVQQRPGASREDEPPEEPDEPIVSDGTDTDMLLIDFR